MQLALAADGVTDQHPHRIRHRRRLNRRDQQRVGLQFLPQRRRQHVGDLGQRPPAALASWLSPRRLTQRIPSTSASVSACENISGGSIKPGRST